jgi:hypothetical protein
MTLLLMQAAKRLSNADDPATLSNMQDDGATAMLRIYGG